MLGCPSRDGGSLRISLNRRTFAGVGIPAQFRPLLSGQLRTETLIIAGGFADFESAGRDGGR